MGIGERQTPTNLQIKPVSAHSQRRAPRTPENTSDKAPHALACGWTISWRGAYEDPDAAAAREIGLG
jgi:hypothetical protein